MYSTSSDSKKPEDGGGFLDELAGQDLTKRSLRMAVASGMYNHSYLLYGPDGTGKSLAAVEFARAINCQSEGPKPCERCDSCLSAAKETNPDITVIRPSGSSFKIDEVRAFIKGIQLRPILYRHRVYVLLHVELLTLESANALLKTLEDPPGEAVIIMTASSIDNLPSTLLSRCQRLRFQALSTGEVASFIKKRKDLPPGLSEDDIQAIASMSEGIPGNALQMARQGNLLQARERCLSALDRLIQGEGRLCSLLDFGEDAVRCGEVTSMMMSLLRDMIILKTRSRRDMVVNRDSEETLAAFSERCSLEGLTSALQEVLDADYALKRNASVRMIMGALGIKLERCFMKRPEVS